MIDFSKLTIEAKKLAGELKQGKFNEAEEARQKLWQAMDGIQQRRNNLPHIPLDRSLTDVNDIAREMGEKKIAILPARELESEGGKNWEDKKNWYEVLVLNENKPIFVISDLHGDFELLENYIVEYLEQFPKRDAIIIFLGDNIHRAFQNLEILIFEVLLKALYPDQVYFIFGNHEFSEYLLQVEGLGAKGTVAKYYCAATGEIEYEKLDCDLEREFGSEVRGDKSDIFEPLLVVIRRFLRTFFSAIIQIKEENNAALFLHGGLEPDKSYTDLREFFFKPGDSVWARYPLYFIGKEAMMLFSEKEARFFSQLAALGFRTIHRGHDHNHSASQISTTLQLMTHYQEKPQEVDSFVIPKVYLEYLNKKIFLEDENFWNYTFQDRINFILAILESTLLLLEQIPKNKLETSPELKDFYEATKERCQVKNFLDKLYEFPEWVKRLFETVNTIFFPKVNCKPLDKEKSFGDKINSALEIMRTVVETKPAYFMRSGDYPDTFWAAPDGREIKPVVQVATTNEEIDSNDDKEINALLALS